MMKKAPAARMIGDKTEGLSVEARVHLIRETLRDHDQRIREAQSIGRKYLDGVTLSERGKAFARTLDAYMEAKRLDRTSLAARVSAMQDLAPLRFSDDCSPGDLKLVLHQGVREEQTGAPSLHMQRHEVLTFSDGTPVGPGEREECARLGSTARYERLRAIAQAKGLDLDKPSSRDIAEGILFAECSSTVSAAKSLAEAIHVVQKQSPTMSLRDATLTAGELRPDLRGSIQGRQTRNGGGGGDVVAFSQEADPRAEVDRLVMAECDRRGLDHDDPRDNATATQVVFGKRPDLARALFFADRAPGVSVDHTQAVAFTAKVEELLAEQSLLRTPTNLAKASSAVRKRYPHLVTVPGSGRRS